LPHDVSISKSGPSAGREGEWDQPELHSKNSSDVLISRLNHQIILEV
jgi:hypothetical protein